jgi:hypothetical protein
MRTSVPSREIAHLWAHQTQEKAKCSASMSFLGTRFYSYGTVIAEIVTNPSGEKAYLISADHYSSTTARHLGDVRSAIPRDAKKFFVSGTHRGGYGFGETTRILREWAAEVESKVEGASKSRQPKTGRLLAEASGIVEKMREFATFFAVEVDLPVIPATMQEIARYFAEREQREAAAAAKRAEEQKKLFAQQKRKGRKHRLAWLNGTSNETYSWKRFFEPELRIVGDEVETSLGVRFPVEHAKRGLVLVESVIARKEEWKANGHSCHLGHYQIERIEANGTVHAGCHVVSYKAIQRVREQILAA